KRGLPGIPGTGSRDDGGRQTGRGRRFPPFSSAAPATHEKGGFGENCATTPTARRRSSRREKSPATERVPADIRNTGWTPVRRPWPTREPSQPRAELPPAT